MKKVGLLLSTVLFSSSCLISTVQTPEERGFEVDYDIQFDHQEDVFDLTVYAVEEHYGKEFGYIYSNIYWMHSRPVWGGRSHSGLTWSCEEMYVTVGLHRPDKMCGTALVHEIGHCLQSRMTGHLDVDHSDKEFWSVISSAIAETCNEGW